MKSEEGECLRQKRAILLADMYVLRVLSKEQMNIRLRERVSLLPDRCKRGSGNESSCVSTKTGLVDGLCR